MNPLAAPRYDRCSVCTLVAVPEDVTIRLYDQELEHLPVGTAVDYLRAVGFAGTARSLKAAVLRHRHHVDAFIARDGATAPISILDGSVTRLAPPVENSGWVDVNQGVMNLGAQATALLEERLRTKADSIDTKDMVAIVGAGSTAATMRANAEMKGQLRRAEAIAKLAAGFTQPAER